MIVKVLVDVVGRAFNLIAQVCVLYDRYVSGLSPSRRLKWSGASGVWIMRNQGIAQFNDIVRTTPASGDLILRGPRNISRKGAYAFGVRMTEPVYGLIVVADDQQRVRVCQQPNQGLIRLVEVLVFVDQHVFELGQSVMRWIRTDETNR